MIMQQLFTESCLASHNLATYNAAAARLDVPTRPYSILSAIHYLVYTHDSFHSTRLITRYP